ncbi:hypothetical protein [Alkalihalobacterium sp. APHAB7]|uniref:hypothetical protein n=1 Tax=Alkalihalobacterium sp. APHAB7 TaxID=3402081 RepID=UPI003AAF3794
MFTKREIDYFANLGEMLAVLMIYRFYDRNFDVERVRAYHLSPDGKEQVREATCKQDEVGYWFMYFI